jgi:hypothetical protein
VRIHRKVRRRIEPAEIAAGVNMFVGKPKSPTSHITFWTLNELRLPQTFSILSLSAFQNCPVLCHGAKKAGPIIVRARAGGMA